MNVVNIMDIEETFILIHKIIFGFSMTFITFVLISSLYFSFYTDTTHNESSLDVDFYMAVFEAESEEEIASIDDGIISFIIFASMLF